MRTVNTYLLGVAAALACGAMLAGCGKNEAHGDAPKRPDSVAQGSAAASRAAIPMAKGEVEIEPIIASNDETVCGACQVCVELCPFDAISIATGVGGKEFAQINSALCKGCGTCVGACPSGAMNQQHFKTEQIMAQISAALEDLGK